MPASYQSAPAPPPLQEQEETDGNRTDSSEGGFMVQGVWWQVLLSLLVLLVIGYFTFDPSALGHLLRSVNPWLLGAAAGTSALQAFLGGWRLTYVSRGRLGLTEGVRGQLAWHFFSNVTPTTVGGGPMAALYMARDARITVGEASAFMLFAMLLDQFWYAASIPLLFIASFYIDIIPASIGAIGAWTVVACFLGLLGWALLFAYATLFRPDLLERLARRLFSLRFLRRFRERMLHEMSQLGRRAQTLRAQPPAFYLKGFLLTALTWISRFALVLFVVWSVDAGADKLLTTLRAAAMMLCALVLPTPGGAGGLEGLYALFIGPLFAEQALIAPTLLVWRLLGYYVFIAFGVYLSTHHVRQTLRRKRSETPAPS